MLSAFHMSDAFGAPISHDADLTTPIARTGATRIPSPASGGKPSRSLPGGDPLDPPGAVLPTPTRRAISTMVSNQAVTPPGPAPQPPTPPLPPGFEIPVSTGAQGGITNLQVSTTAIDEVVAQAQAQQQKPAEESIFKKPLYWVGVAAVVGVLGAGAYLVLK